MNAITSVLLRLKAMGLTQVEINRLTGIPQPRLSRWAAGAVPPAAEDALKLKGLLEGMEVAANDDVNPKLAAQPGAPSIPVAANDEAAAKLAA